MIDRAVLAEDQRDVVHMLPENERRQHYDYRYEAEVKEELLKEESSVVGKKKKNLMDTTGLFRYNTIRL